MRRWLPAALLALAAVVVCLAVWSWPDWIASAGRDLEGPIVARSDSKPPALSATMALASNHASPGEPVRFSLLLVNSSTGGVRGARVRILAPAGFAVPDLLSAAPALARPISPGAGRRLTASVVSHGLGRFQFSVLVDSWDASGRLSTAAVSAGPIVVRDFSMSEARRLLSALLGLFKDLALPIVLALLAWLLKRRDDERQAARDANEKAAERLRHAADQKRAIIQETWNLMLPTSHRYAAEYYVPLVGVADRLKAAVDRSLLPVAKTAAQTEEERRVCLHLLLGFLREIRQITIKIGGIFLKNRLAEEVVALSWKAFRSQFETRLDRASLETVLRVMTWHEDYATFSERFDPAKPEHAALQKLLSDFTIWRDHGLPADLHILELFSIVLLSEVNRTYEYWYEPAGEFPRTKFNAAHTAINARTDCGELKASAKRYTDYLDDAGPVL